MKKFLNFLLISMLFVILCACGGTSTANPGNVTGENGESGGMMDHTLHKISDKDLSLEISGVRSDNVTYYTVKVPTIETSVDDLYTPSQEFESVTELQNSLSQTSEDLKNALTSIEGITDLSISSQSDFSMTGVANTEDPNANVTINWYVDGTKQVTYGYQWGNESGMMDFDVEKIVGVIRNLIGFNINSNDIYDVQNKIFSNSESGSYSVVMTTEDGSNGFYISVSNYNTDTENWQLFVQRCAKFADSASTGVADSGSEVDPSQG